MKLSTLSSDPYDPELVVDSVRPREVLSGEALTVQPIGARLASIELLDLDASCGPEIEENTIRFAPDDSGHFRFMVHATDGQQAELRVTLCEPECLDRCKRVPPVPPGVAPPRMVLRSLVGHGHEWFTGRSEQLVNRSLANYGA